jgi:large subunit ribosomal protein L5
MAVSTENITKYQKEWKETPMRAIRLEKVVLNFALGKSGPELERARILAENLTNKKPVDSIAHESIRGFNIRKGEPIGVHVTMRREDGVEFLKKIFWAKDDKVLIRNFDNNGNLAMSIKDHLTLPEVRYDPKIGVFGFGVTANLERKGFRIKRRRLRTKKIPNSHKISKEECMAWFLSNFENLKIVKTQEELEE